jgi:hypothetical protein
MYLEATDVSNWIRGLYRKCTTLVPKIAGMAPCGANLHHMEPKSDAIGTNVVQKCTTLHPCPFETPLTVIRTISSLVPLEMKTCDFYANQGFEFRCSGSLRINGNDQRSGFTISYILAVKG